MILFLTTMVAMAKPDVLVTHLESRSYRLNGKMLVVSKDKVLLGKIDSSQLQTETLPKMGDIDKEITRLQNKYGVTCVVNIEPVVETNTQQEEDKEEDKEDTEDKEAKNDHTQQVQVISGVSITDMGTCTADSSVRYSIKDNGSLWTVVDSQGVPVSVQAFANVCEDIPLLLKLDLEEQVANRNGQILQWGATALGVGGLFTMGNPDPGFSAREQNKFWTGVFLFGSAAILYTQRDMPFAYKTEHQTKLSNYHTREEVDRILLKTFGVEESSEDTTNEGVESTEAANTESNPEDTKSNGQDSQNPDSTVNESSDESSDSITRPLKENAQPNEQSIVEPKPIPDTSTGTKKETPASSDDPDNSNSSDDSKDQQSKDQPAEVQP